MTGSSKGKEPNRPIQTVPEEGSLQGRPVDQISSYGIEHFVLDIYPVALAVLLHITLWKNGFVWTVGIVATLQIVGAAYMFHALANQMLRVEKKAMPSTESVSPSPPSLSSSPFSPSSPGLTSKRTKKHLEYFDLVSAQTVNPFLHPAWLLKSQWERLRIALMSVTLVPVRVFATFSVLITLWFALHFVLFGVSTKRRLNHPLDPWRSRILAFLVPTMAKILLVCGFGFFNVQSIGELQSTRDPRLAPVVIANHSSFIDPFIIFSTRLVSAVGAIDNLRLPILGTICEAIQTITVDRKDDNSRHAVVETIKQRASWATKTDAEKQAMEGKNGHLKLWPQILIFPEGTCENGSALINFKPGAFVSGKPVQPMLIHYLGYKYPNQRFHPCWVSAGPSMGMVALRMWSEPINYAVIEYLPPISLEEALKATGGSAASSKKKKPIHNTAAAEEGAGASSPPPASAASSSDRQSDSTSIFARYCRRVMADRLGVPVTEHSYEDVVLQDLALGVGRKRRAKNQHAAEGKGGRRMSEVERRSSVGDPSIRAQMLNPSNFPPATPATPSTPGAPLLTASLEVSALKKVFNTDLDTIQKHLAKFQAMDVRRRGQVNYQEFLHFFDIDAHTDELEGENSSMRHLFDLLDEDESGTLDVREFLLGLALVSELGASAIHKLAFQMFDTDEDGLLQISDLRRVLRRAFPDMTDQEMEEAIADAQGEEGGGGGDEEETAGGGKRNNKSQQKKTALTYEEFEKYCEKHPTYVLKFRKTLLF